jgi:iron complex outermembrane recepter protein
MTAHCAQVVPAGAHSFSVSAGTFLTVAASWLLAAPAAAQQADHIESLARMSLAELGNVEVTSVSKAAEPLGQAPTAIYVITHDDIIRSGATSLPEALRLAPNILITQLTSSNYVAAARGFGGNPDAQSFSNKLLILIDGRSVYTPLFSGVYFDAQDVIFDDVDRIEVISGPGATLWGANAVNGVINVIMRPARLTTGTLVTVGAGDFEQKATVRFGGRLGDEIDFRVYGKGFKRASLEVADGSNAHDDWYKGQGGFRADWKRGPDAVTLQGDVYRGIENQLGTGKQSIVGANALARWQHSAEHSDLQLQTYYDQTQRAAPAGGVAFVLRTYDFELQQSIALNSSHKLVWGAGVRLNSYNITNSAGLAFWPPARNLTLVNVFAQDTISLGSKLKLTLGGKIEDDPYSGREVLPDARLAWQVGRATLLWASASRAIRSPTPFDVDVVETLGTTVFLTGNQQFQPERVTTYEIGYRGEVTPAFSLSVSGFYNRYKDQRSIETASRTVFLPLRWGNLIEGHAYGLTAWAKWRVADWWRLSPGFTILHKDLQFSPGASRLLGIAQAGDDPTGHASIQSSMDLGRQVTLDALIRYVGALPDPAAPAYHELDGRLGWQVSKVLDISLTGSNLLHARHQEFAVPAGEEIGRSVFLRARWIF